MSKKIREALLKLDSANEEHWTTEGLPRLDVMKDLVGEAVSRADITGAAKSFSRSNATLEEATPEGGEQTQPDAGAPPADVTPPVTTPPAEPTVETPFDDTGEELEGDEAVEAELEAARKNFADAQERLREANAAMDVVINRREEEAAGRTTAHDIKAYQKSQQAQRIGNANRARAMANAVKAVQDQ